MQFGNTNAPQDVKAVGFGISQNQIDPNQTVDASQMFNQSINPGFPCANMTPVNPQFTAGLVYVNTPTAPNYVNFGQMVQMNSGINPDALQFSAPGLVTEGKALGQSVGLSMDSLIKSSPVPANDGTPTPEYVPQINVLMSNEPFVPMQKFSIQPLPENVDLSMLPKPTLAESAIEDINAHLSKNNQPLQNDYLNGKKLNNWFTRLLDQRGADYISSGKLNVEEVSKNAEKILDDMISGRVDYNKQGNIIIQPIIIETLINYCANKLAINKAIQYALGYIYNDYTNRMAFTGEEQRFAYLVNIDDTLARNITQSIAIVNQDIGIYEILYTKLRYVNDTKNASSLFSLTNELNNYRKQMKKRY